MIKTTSTNMSLANILSYEGKFNLKLPSSFVNRFPNINLDPNIHSGRPHIKGTRVLAADIFKANAIKGYSLGKIRMEFKEMGIDLDEKILDEAISFTLSLLQYIKSGNKDK